MAILTPAPDIPAVLAGPLIAAVIIAFAYLATIDWTHPDHDQEKP
ncbi:hypothetical protein ACTWJ9_33135 (plasmid) [Streptomyces sp. GDS52]